MAQKNRSMCIILKWWYELEAAIMWECLFEQKPKLCPLDKIIAFLVTEGALWRFFHRLFKDIY